MPIKVAKGLPAIADLKAEHVTVIDEARAISQDIRPLKIAILNLMPTKETTELQLLRLLGNTPLQISVEFLHMASHHSTHVPVSHLKEYYKTFDEIKDCRYDGLIITGAPVEEHPYQNVDYIEELDELLEWSATHVYSRLFICWGAQYGLNRLHSIAKHPLPTKRFGIYPYEVLAADDPLLRGFNDTYYTPQSRHTAVDEEAVIANPELKVLTASKQWGLDLISARDGRDLFLLGHLEYDRETLKKEYLRDRSRGLPIDVPVNYFKNDDPEEEPVFSWRSYAFLLYNNWINQTYQNTYYNLSELDNN